MARETATKLSGQDWRHLCTAAAIVSGVLGTLLLGARLEADASDVTHPGVTTSEAARTRTSHPAPAPQAPAPQPVASKHEAKPTMEPEPEIRSKPEPKPAKALPSRPQARPAERPAQPGVAAATTSSPSPSGWTLQFMVTCTAETAKRLRDELGQDPQLHLTPITVKGRDCTRICWGNYESRHAALALEGIPAALTAINAKPLPRRVPERVAGTR